MATIKREFVNKKKQQLKETDKFLLNVVKNIIKGTFYQVLLLLGHTKPFHINFYNKRNLKVWKVEHLLYYRSFTSINFHVTDNKTNFNKKQTNVAGCVCPNHRHSIDLLSLFIFFEKN